MCRTVCESEDEAELARSELAMTVMLLRRNYSLSPRQFQEILGFDDDPETRFSVQSAVHHHLFESGRIPSQAAELLEASRGPSLQSLIAFCSGRVRLTFSFWSN